MSDEAIEKEVQKEIKQLFMQGVRRVTILVKCGVI
jgi:hypothetical protein